MSKRLGGIIGCKYKTSSWHLNGFPYGSNIEATEQATFLRHYRICTEIRTEQSYKEELFLCSENNTSFFSGEFHYTGAFIMPTLYQYIIKVSVGKRGAYWSMMTYQGSTRLKLP